MKWNDIKKVQPPHGKAVQVKIKVITIAVWHRYRGWPEFSTDEFEVTHWREIPKSSIQ